MRHTQVRTQRRLLHLGLNTDLTWTSVAGRYLWRCVGGCEEHTTNSTERRLARVTCRWSRWSLRESEARKLETHLSETTSNAKKHTTSLAHSTSTFPTSTTLQTAYLSLKIGMRGADLFNNKKLLKQ